MSRILAHKDGYEMYFQIHEVYYDKEGKPDEYNTEILKAIDLMILMSSNKKKY